MKLKTILWDFDGVILDSMTVRDQAFRVALGSYPKSQVEALVEYHQNNGGLSRFHKLRVFFERIRNDSVSDERIAELAQTFSDYCMRQLSEKQLLVKEAIRFIETHHTSFHFHIVSGSAQIELRQLCTNLEIDQYFGQILGSPTPKNQLVHDLIDAENLEKAKTGLVGDSKNDYEAASRNGIHFFGYRNESLRGLGTYLDRIDDLPV